MTKHALSAISDLELSRRGFLGGALGAAAVPVLASALSAEEKPAEKRKIKLGLVGCGGRGSWIGGLFQAHGGYEVHAVADYFQAVADRCGDALKVDKGRRFSGLHGYRRLIDAGVEAVALIVPPCFLPEQASYAAEHGLHVYMAKPVAVDVHGCMEVLSAGKTATDKKKAFLVDYQMPTDPVNIQIAERLWKEDKAKYAKLVTAGVNGGRPDPAKTANIESRLQGLVWDNDVAIGGSFINSYDIHAIDTAVWVAKQRPVAAMGLSRICRSNPHGDSHDVISVVYEYADGLIHEHQGLALPNREDSILSCTVYTETAHAVINYWGKSHFLRRHNNKPIEGEVVDLYAAGANRNIAAFYAEVVGGKYDNPTVARAVDGCLTCLLGREAGFRKARLTMDEMIKENRRVEVDRTGLKI